MFRDRMDAGEQLAQSILPHKGQDVAVFALPRGGVVLGVEVARALEAPLELIIVRKIGHPQSPEFAIGAVAEDGYVVTSSWEAALVDKWWLESEIHNQQAEAKRRRKFFTGGRERLSARGKVAIIVDDGLATGLTMSAAIHEIQAQQPRQIILAVPVASRDAIDKLRPLVDDIVVLHVPDLGFGSVGSFYECFDQVSDGEVVELMESLALTTRK